MRAVVKGVGYRRGGRAEPASGDPPTSRELEVIRHVAAGETNQQVGIGLCMAKRTVDKHLLNVFKKLGVRNRAGLVTQAFILGLIKVEDFNA